LSKAQEDEMKTLNIVASAYRASIEEQDDTIVWLTHAIKGAGADIDVLLRGDAVNYALRGQDASGLAFGAWTQTQPPRIEHDLAGLCAKGVGVHVLADDLTRRGLQRAPLVPGVQPLDSDALAALLAQYERIWHW
jgi:sulfur relay (sulfurtransferase) DsrF/TusC family protein